VQQLKALRHSYGRQNEPFEIMLALREAPRHRARSGQAGSRSRDRCGDVFAVGGLDELLAGGTSTESAERFRPAIERFAETVIAKCR
jgi:hypothetical protein